MLPDDPEQGSGEEVPVAETGDPASVQTGRDAVNPSDVLLTGTVKDRSTGRLIQLFQFTLKWVEEDGPNPGLFDETVKNKDGRFSFPLKQTGDFKLTLQSPNHLCKYMDFSIPEGAKKEDLYIELDPVFRTHGRVVDGETGLPVEGAVVRVVDRMGRSDLQHGQ
ncbi:MAG: hypothetical protein KJ645_07680 [Planctomycetes bacterium]|nr:hypothetical protein [Planctomycetota bacterium]